MIHNLTGLGVPVKAENPILTVGRIFRIKRTAGERAGFARLAPGLSCRRRVPSHVA
jgi:hypothetical protein